MKKGKIFLSTLISQLYTWFKTQKTLLFLIILLFAVYWKWWVPGVRTATDFPAVSMPDLNGQFNIPQLWFLRGSIGFGGYSVFTLWSWLMDLTAGLLSNFGVAFEVLERMMFIIPILLIGVFGIWNLLNRFGLSKSSKFIASLFYLTNTYILLLIDGGQLSVGLAYAWFPCAYLLFVDSLGKDIKKQIIAAFGLWILGVLDIRFTYILGILLILRFFYEMVFPRKEEDRIIETLGWIKSSFLAVLIFILLNTYWIIPFIKYPLSSARFSDLTKISDLNFTKLKHSLALLQPHWYENIFGRIAPFRKEFLLIPVLAFLAPILKRKNKEVWFWAVIAAVSIFLAKGANTPLPGVYPWLFTHIPGFSLFRDSTKFFFLVALSYSVLIAFTVDEITKRFSKLKVIFPVFIVIYLLFLIRPVYLGQMTGTFSMPRYQNEYFSIAKKLEEDKNFGRIFWISARPPLGYASPLHSSLEASRLESLRPFAVSTVGTYETQNFIREGNYMGELFDVAGIEYLAYPYFDPMRDDMSKEKVDYYNTFLSQISNLSWISEKISDVPIPVFKTKENKDKFFLSQNTYFIVGSDRIYSDIKNFGAKFSDNALIFSEENTGPINQIEKIPRAKIVLYDKNPTDLAFSFVEKNKFISPSADLGFSPSTGSGSSSWWKREATDLVWTRDFLQWKYGIDNLDFDYGQGWAIAEGERELSITNNQFSKEKILYVRVMNSSRGGDVSFYQNDNLIGRVDTKIEIPEVVTIKLTGNKDVPDRFNKYDKADFHWVRVGEIKENGSLTIKTRGDINIVNSLAVISPSSEGFINEKILNLKESGRIVLWNGLDTEGKKNLLAVSNQAKVSYQSLAPTHYKVKVEGLETPTTLFFSETFDSGWELSGQKAYKLYSLINGFWVDHDGEYDLYFTPQKYVIPGLIVSAITLTSCIMILVWKKRSQA